VIGTHAVIQQGVTFAKLGLAVVDEQHRFGVLQRKTLIEKGYRPDVLVLTATPIPRTLAMTVYGDLDVSVIDQIPPGRKPVRTFLMSESQRGRPIRFYAITAERSAGLCGVSLVEESEKTDLQAAMQGAEQLQADELAEFRVGLLHGRMKSEEKEQVMASYKKGAIQVPGLDDGGGGRGRCGQCHGSDDRACRGNGLAHCVTNCADVGRSGYQSYCLHCGLVSTVSIGEAQAAGERYQRPGRGWRRLCDRLMGL
jgi:ATP-dependent DNA helicase RecG